MSDTLAVANRVVAFWHETGADPRPGVDAGALSDFRLHNDAEIPTELATFYRATNGIESDANLFAVWSLGAVRRVPEALGDFRGILTTGTSSTRSLTPGHTSSSPTT